MKTCETCEYFSALAQQCREDSPKSFLVGVHPQQGPMFSSTWPNTTKDLGCGKHKAEINTSSFVTGLTVERNLVREGD